MLLKISRCLTSCLIKRNIIEFEDTDVFIYGFQLILSTFSSVITILLLSYFINILYGIVFLLFFMPVRFCAGGYHADTYLKCFVYTNSCFVFTLLFSKIVEKFHLLHAYSLLTLIGVLYLWMKAPCRNENNPMSETYIHINRISAHVILMIYSIILTITYHLHSFIFLLGFNTVFLVSILFIIGNLENKH